MADLFKLFVLFIFIFFLVSNSKANKTTVGEDFLHSNDFIDKSHNSLFVEG